jgi:hypothetical protein
MPITPETKTKIYSLLKKVAEENCPPLVIAKNAKESFEVIGNIATPYGSKKVMVPGMYFASAVIKKDNVSFYFFPIYYHLKDYEKLVPATLKCLDGKTCFHFKKEEQLVEKEIRAMFKKGIEMYKKQGWLK